MDKIGFSTGGLALGDFRAALKMINGKHGNAIELSALRDIELQPLIDSLDDINLDRFKYVSFHAPSKRETLSEFQITEQLHRLDSRSWAIIVHPDIIQNDHLWRPFGNRLCIENMDKRKSIGRTAQELGPIFQRLPDASFCLDLAHARQIDPTMMEAGEMIQAFYSRMTQMHISDVNSESKHERLNLEAIIAYHRVCSTLRHVPVILESPVAASFLENELENARCIFDNVRFNKCIRDWDARSIQSSLHSQVYSWDNIRSNSPNPDSLHKGVHVVKSGNRWAVKVEGNSTPKSTHRTQELARQSAIPVAKRNYSEVVVHSPSGQIRSDHSAVSGSVSRRRKKAK